MKEIGQKSDFYELRAHSIRNVKAEAMVIFIASGEMEPMFADWANMGQAEMWVHDKIRWFWVAASSLYRTDALKNVPTTERKFEDL